MVNGASSWLWSRRRLLPWIVAAGLFLALFGRFGVKHAREALRVVLEPGSLARVESHAPGIRAVASEFELDPCLVAGIVYVESRGKVGAVSSANALGLMQVTAPAVHDASIALGVPEPSREQLLSDTALNLRFGARHFAWTLRHEERQVERALCAYNAGRGRLRGWIEQAGGYTRWREKQLRDGDSHVLEYAQDVLAFAEVFRERGVIEDRVPAPLDPDDAQPAKPSSP